ncbi:MAG: ATP-dependent DNA helicase RecG [Gammaproteobacteria bacterium]|nr:ATP-dependent DNA helicase RecG [Gammaproteobacteria bacterium]NIR83943.1 ATP-dependent DNA helicase RecG [Gammaproteobacteria bacterium]NIR88986.1 ATP-dependent DNA helicase RecG [Gammaproteobacteria bacterium]NIV74539.1 ATP-dependent DNA helicase RecG [Gammaproteobacteria bacterium]
MPETESAHAPTRPPGAASRSAALARLPVTALSGVGSRIAQRLAALEIRSVQDLLLHLPTRYQDRTRLTPIGALRPGEHVAVAGEILLSQVLHGRRRSLVCRLADGSGSMDLRFFHFTRGQQNALARGAHVQCFGEVRRGPRGLELVHPEHRLLTPGTTPAAETRLTPIYPSTEGLHQITLRKLADQALALARRPGALVDHLPPALCRHLDLPTLNEALEIVHHPPPEADLAALEAGTHPAHRRLALEELLAHHLSLRLLRKRLETEPAPPLHATGALRERFVHCLPFTLTPAQHRVAEEIAADLAGSTPMHRLLQGDVGSGKTVVAALAALQTIEAGFQVAVMAPTDLLAEQHAQSFGQWLAPLGIAYASLLGKMSGSARTRALEAIGGHQVQLVVGTHALFQEHVTFARLGLIIIDEQHRFGVHQRLALRSKGVHEGHHPHQLIMTATPIPRTLAMTAYADLDVSVIDALPPGRKPVDTAVVPDTRRAEVIQRVRDASREKRQVYWVCTLVEESESLQCEAAADTAERLAEALPEVRVGLVHGRMKAAEKERTMGAFKRGDVDLLVATTVIEVGVDVPNASLMIIENAERLGLAQLHQLRGRVGRGARQSVCLLLYKGPLSANARTRLAALRATNDGFEIARRDLELRGPGEVLGTRQTGMLELRVADLARDRALFPAVERAGSEILAQHPERATPLIQRWLGDSAHYADV